MAALHIVPLSGFQVLMQKFLSDLFVSLSNTMVFMILLLVLRILLRRQDAAICSVWVLGTTWMFFGHYQGPHWGLRLAITGLMAGIHVLAFVRFGLLAGSILILTSRLGDFPLTLNLSAWYSPSTLFVVMVVGTLALYGFNTATAGQRWFARSGVLND